MHLHEMELYLTLQSMNGMMTFRGFVCEINWQVVVGENEIYFTLNAGGNGM